MRLPFFGSFGKKEVKNYFLALLLQDEKIGAVILEEVEGKIHVATRAEEQFATTLEKSSFEELLETIDKAVSLAETSEGLDIQTEKTVFGVKQDWIEEGKIKKDYLLKLKKVCEELALEPIGFLVFTEAIIHLLQQEEGAPVSAILVETGKKFLSLSLIRAGRIIQTHLVPNEDHIPTAVDSALKHFDTEILPARIILYTQEPNEKLTQSFISHSWSKNLPFLHMPQITVLPPDFDTKGVLHGTASQMGFEVVDEHPIPSKTYSKGKEIISDKKEEISDEGIAEKGESSFAKASEDKEETASDEEIESQEKSGETDEEIAASFKKHVDEAPSLETKESSETLEEQIQEDEENKEKAQTEIVNSEFFGFVENKDVSNISHKDLPKYQKSLGKNEGNDVFEEIPEDVKDEETGEKDHTGDIGSQAGLIMSGMQKVLGRVLENAPAITNTFTGIFAKLSQRKPGSSAKNPASTSLKPIAIIAIILVVLLGIVLFYMFGTSANVAINLNPQVINETSPVTFSLDGQSDFNSNQLGAKTIQQDESGSLSQDTTGTKQTGTQAKGTITITSAITDTVTLAKGTKVTSDNGEVFTLDQDTQVASSSGNAGDFITVDNVSVTAVNFGPDSNLPSATKFSIDGYSKGDMIAKNDNPFSGGTKEDVQVVSKDDVNNVLTTITKNLEPNATGDIKKQLSDTQELLSFFAKEDVTKKDLDKNIGDESKTVSVNATITYTGIVVDKNDLNNFATNAVKEKLSNPSQTNVKIETNLTDVKQDSNSISGNLQIKATVLPQIDTIQLAKNISGKSFSNAISDIKNTPQVSDATIALSPNLPLFPHILPRIPSHIHIHFVTQ